MSDDNLSLQLKELIKQHPAIKRQFIYSPLEKKGYDFVADDPLAEEKKSPVKGLIHRYHNRALILLTMNCAAFCRFCTRRSNFKEYKKQKLTKQDIEKIILYLKQHKKISEILVSGGDSLIQPELLKIVLQKISSLRQIKVIRVCTRLPVTNPSLINNEVISALKKIKKQPLYIMVHFEHPAEITALTVKAIKKLQAVSTMVLSQSVFLKGVNDDEKTLSSLFTKLIEIGVKPYYLFHCDAVQGAGHFIVSEKKEKEIFNNLKKKLSGLALPHYVIDTPHGKQIKC